MGLPMDILTEETVDVVDLFGAQGHEVIERLMETRNPEKRFATVETFLLRLARNESKVSPLAQAAIAELTRSRGSTAIQALATEFQVSRRHLGLTLRRHVGLGTKSYARIMRLQYSLAAIRNDSHSTLTEVGLEAGYFDQAHFIKDFRDFCGVSPREFARQEHNLADAFH